MAKKYVKKPTVVEAMQFKDDVETLKELSDFMEIEELRVSYEDPKNPKASVRTLEGTVKASVGDYIIKNNTRNFCVCSKELFESVYEEV